MFDMTFVFCNLTIDMNSQEGQSADRISVSVRNEIVWFLIQIYTLYNQSTSVHNRGEMIYLQYVLS